MKLLLIEDEDRSVRQILPRIQRAAPGCEVTVAASRDEALLLFAQNAFDLIICDIRIPPSEASADIDEKHGLLVSASVRLEAPGTPVIFLTAFSTGKDTLAQLSNGEVHNAFGIANYPMNFLCMKDDLAEIEERIRVVNEALVELEALCEIRASDIDDAMFLRAVREYSKQIHHPVVEINASGGFSGAITGRVTLWSTSGNEAAVFMKVADHASAIDEYNRFNLYVPNRIQPGFSAPFLPPTVAGLRKKAALISTLADRRCRSIFDVLLSDPSGAADAVRQLRDSTKAWWQSGASEVVTLAALRRRHLSDEKAEIAGIDPRGLVEQEDVEVLVKSCIAHGDLHGENVFVDETGRPMMIDFGDVGFAAAPIDPVTLELSLLFYPKGPAQATPWGRGVDGASWPDLDAFVQDSPFAEFVTACRSWAMEVDSPDSVYATVYAHAMRQLKYPKAPRDLALNVAKSALAKLSAN